MKWLLGDQNDHVLDDDTCSGWFLIRNLLRTETSLSSSRNDRIAWKYRKTTNIIQKNYS